MKTRWMGRAATIAASWVLTACGGGGDGSGGTSEAPVVKPTTSSISLLAAGPADSVPSDGRTQVTIIVSNAEGATATGVVLNPNFATGLALKDYACTAMGNVVCPKYGSADSMALPDLPAHASLKLVFTLDVAARTSGDLTSTPTIRASNDATTTDNAAVVLIKAYSADLSVSASGQAAPVIAGSTTTYTMTVSNAGPDEARDVIIINALSDLQTPGAFSCSAAGGAICPALSSADMRVPLLPKNASLTFKVPAKVADSASGGISNAMSVSAAGDPDVSNNSAAVQLAAYVPAATASAGQTLVILSSDPDDFIGAGGIYTYTRSNANFWTSDEGIRFKFSVNGDENWDMEIWQRDGSSQFKPGTYAGLPESTFRWYGQSRGCNVSSSDITIGGVTYVAGQLSMIDFTFEQHCDGKGPALRGYVRWHANDPTTPAGPIVPPPASLWSAPAGSTPATGNYVYLQSDPGDYIDDGRTRIYTQANAILSVSAAGGLAKVKVAGDQNWDSDFQAMVSLATLQPGYYGSLKGFPFFNPTRGGLDWFGEGRGCNILNGWFAIDNVSYVDATLTTLDLRFEQHCEGLSPAVRGQIHWDASDRTAPPGPISPPPVALWAPAAGATPASGSYVYLESDASDYIGQGKTYTHTKANAVLTASATGRLLSMWVNGSESWNGNFQAMAGLAELKSGYYGDLQRYPFNNQAKGGLTWSGGSRGCNALSGWFVVDNVSYVNGQLTRLDLRFEQHCDGFAAALHGKIHLEP